MHAGLRAVLMVMIIAVVVGHLARNNSIIYTLLVVGLLMTSGCAYTTAEKVKAKVGAPEPDVAMFSHCSSYGCQVVQQVAFEPQEWKQITEIFAKQPTSALEERELLPKAIALMEEIVGPKTGTADDIARSWTFTFMPKGQLDCIDGSINTTTYLQILDQAGFVNFHDIGTIALRGNKFDLMLLHNTATLIEHDSGISYAIDSWFRANGIAPDVVLLDDWISGWKPGS